MFVSHLSLTQLTVCSCRAPSPPPKSQFLSGAIMKTDFWVMLAVVIPSFARLVGGAVVLEEGTTNNNKGGGRNNKRK